MSVEDSAYDDLEEEIERLSAELAALRTENEHLAMRVNAVMEVLEGIIITSRPGTPKSAKERAWKLAGTMLAIREARAAAVGVNSETEEPRGNDGF